MKKKLYFLLAFGVAAALVQSPAHATGLGVSKVEVASPLDLSTSPTSKSPAGKMRSNKVLAILGLAESKKVMTPSKLNREQYLRQKQLKAKARREARAHRRRIPKALN